MVLLYLPNLAGAYLWRILKKQTDAACLNEAGTVQQDGSFVLASHVAYKSVQLGSISVDSRRSRTPRYSTQPKENRKSNSKVAYTRGQNVPHVSQQSRPALGRQTGLVME